MPQSSKKSVDDLRANLDRFALRALSLLAKELRMVGKLKQRRMELFVRELYAAVSSPDKQAAPSLVQTMLANGFEPTEIADLYIPEVARRLGDAWCSDNLDFAKVTIGAARLQGMLRGLGPEWCAEDTHVAADAPRCLVVVPPDAQHTLGATILAGQMRRAGLSVSLEIGRSVDDLQQMVEQAPFDAVMISASAQESLAVIGCIVQRVRSVRRDVPVVVGGNILALDEDIARVTGADLATCALEEAIRFCGFDARMLRIVADS